MVNKINPDFIEANLGLVGMVLKSVECPPHETYDDLFNEGVLGLYDASSHYDPDKGAFSSLAIKCIRHKVFNYLRKGANRSPVFLDDQNEQEEKSSMDLEDNLDLKNALDSLPKMEKEVIDRIFNNGHTLKEIGKQLGLSHTTIARTRDRALAKMKKAV